MTIALDTPFEPSGWVDGIFATDNFRAGELIGRWVKTRLGDAAKRARIVTLDGFEARIAVDVLRNQGFLNGFGVDTLSTPAERHDTVRSVRHLFTSALTRTAAVGPDRDMGSGYCAKPSPFGVAPAPSPNLAGVSPGDICHSIGMRMTTPPITSPTLRSLRGESLWPLWHSTQASTTA